MIYIIDQKNMTRGYQASQDFYTADMVVIKQDNGQYFVIKDRNNTAGRYISKEDLFVEAI